MQQDAGRCRCGPPLASSVDKICNLYYGYLVWLHIPPERGHTISSDGEQARCQHPKVILCGCNPLRFGHSLPYVTLIGAFSENKHKEKKFSSTFSIQHLQRLCFYYYIHTSKHLLLKIQIFF